MYCAGSFFFLNLIYLSGMYLGISNMYLSGMDMLVIWIYLCFIDEWFGRENSYCKDVIIDSTFFL